MDKIQESIDKLNDSVLLLLAEDPVKNVDTIKELTRSIQRLTRARRYESKA